MGTNGKLEDERNVLATIVARHSSQECQLIRSRTTLAHPVGPTAEERQRTIDGIEQRLPKLCPSTLSDFAAKNEEEHDVHATFMLGPEFIAVTDEEFWELIKQGGWHGLPKKYPGTKGIIDCSRVGLSDDATQALVYFGHQAAAKSGIGSFRLFGRETDGRWHQRQTLRAWIS